MTDAPDPYARARAAIAVLAVDPVGLGGLWLRARPSPQRDLVMEALALVRLPAIRLAPNVTDETLFGGTDLTASLVAGRAILSRGLLSGPRAIILAMAERCPAALAVRLGQWLDRGIGCLIALDEGADAEESLPAALVDRLGLFLDLDGISARVPLGPPDAQLLADARGRLPYVRTPTRAVEMLTNIAASVGIGSLRAPLLALAAARAHAALRNATEVQDEDLRLAVELIFAHRALPEPEGAEDQPAPEPPPPDDQQGEGRMNDPETLSIPQDMLLEAVRAALPADLLARLASGRAARAASGTSGSGAAKKGNRRGRPLASRAGRPDGQSRIDPIATLRAAAPWQGVRRALQPGSKGLLIRPDDFRLRRFQELSDRVLIFTVDASGSAALARLAEAKGAVELLLAQAYARRDHVALVAFRGTFAELLLPPTRSLVQTKRRLAGLPGGGGTPLAAGLQMAMEVARLSRGRGMTPTVALLTDGRANIDLGGKADRPQANEDAARMARALSVSGTPAIVLDTATRPQPALQLLARQMGAAYLALPRADSRRMSLALSGALSVAGGAA
jgi:magnesium chelatase subunit D